MIGYPQNLNSKSDWRNTVAYAKEHSEYALMTVAKLKRLKESIYMNVLKETSKGKAAEEQTPEDYEKVLDPNPEKVRLGISDDEINAWILELGGKA